MPLILRVPQSVEWPNLNNFSFALKMVCQTSWADVVPSQILTVELYIPSSSPSISSVPLLLRLINNEQKQKQLQGFYYQIFRETQKGLLWCGGSASKPAGVSQLKKRLS